MIQIDVLLNQLFAVVIGALLTFLVGYIATKAPRLITGFVNFVVNQAELVRSRFTKEQLAIFDNLVLTVIRDIEQRTTIDDIIKAGWEKREEALKSIKEECERLGIPFDAVYAGKVLEAAIKLGLEQSNFPIIEAVELKDDSK